MSPSLTIHDIAREAGVSASTVSRVLSGHPNVSAKTREQVMRVVRKYDFQPNSLARGLQQQRSQTLGIIMPDVDHPHYAELFTAAYDQARELGYTLTLYSLHPGEGITDEFVSQLIERRLDGVILTGGCVESQSFQDLPALLGKLKRYMPLVAVCSPIPGVSCVHIYDDMALGMRLCVRHLSSLGHRRIALLGEAEENASFRTMQARLCGYLGEMQALSLAPLTLHTDRHRPANGEMGVLRLFDSLPEGERPTALITVNDMVALGAIRQLHRMGLCVPDDVAVVGCDNEFFTAYTLPSITTLDLHVAEHGRLAVRELAAQIASPGGAYHRVYEPALIIRESCGCQLGRRDL